MLAKFCYRIINVHIVVSTAYRLNTSKYRGSKFNYYNAIIANRMNTYCFGNLMKRIALVFIILITLVNNLAADVNQKQDCGISKYQRIADNEFAAGKWYPKHYFLLGAGFSAISSISQNEENKSITGFNFYTALGYWLFDAIGFEIGASLNFGYFYDVTMTQYLEESDGSLTPHKLENFNAFVWDSSYFWGIMARLPIGFRTDMVNLYVKLFQGYGSSVYRVFDNEQDVLHKDATRFFSQGMMFGVAVGNIFNAFNKQTTWFMQLSIYIMMFEESLAIKDGGVLPETLAKDKVNNNLRFIQVLLTFGFRLY